MAGRRLLVGAALAVAGLGAAAVQEAFPSRPIQVFTLYPAGGATDLMARAMAAELSQHLGQAVRSQPCAEKSSAAQSSIAWR